MRPGEANRSFVQGRSVGRAKGQSKLQERPHILYEDNRFLRDVWTSLPCHNAILIMQMLKLWPLNPSWKFWRIKRGTDYYYCHKIPSSESLFRFQPFTDTKIYAFELELALRAFIPWQTRTCIYA